MCNSGYRAYNEKFLVYRGGIIICLMKKLLRLQTIQNRLIGLQQNQQYKSVMNNIRLHGNQGIKVSL